MYRLPVLSGRQVMRALARAGFDVVAQEGSHAKLRKVTQERIYTVIVPVHPELARGTLRSILRQAGLSPEERRGLL